MLKAKETCGPSTQLPRKLVARTPVCSVPKLRDSPENMRCLERSFSTTARVALSHLHCNHVFYAFRIHQQMQRIEPSSAACASMREKSDILQGMPTFWQPCSG